MMKRARPAFVPPVLSFLTTAAVIFVLSTLASALDDPYLIEPFVTAHQAPDLDVQILEPDYGPDGEHILVSYRSSHVSWSLHVLKPDGSTRVVLEDATGEINNGHSPRPAWSPDGTRIAYLTTATLHQADAAELFLTDSVGSPPVQLTQLSKLLGRPDWSPDGERIAIQVADAQQETVDLYMVSLDGTLEHLAAATGVAAEASPWVPEGSPDDGRIGYPGAVSWSADGSRIFYGTADGIYVAMVDGSGVELVVPGSYTDPALSSDGHTLAVAGLIGPAPPSRFGFSFPPPMSALYLVDLNEEEMEPQMVVSPYWFADIGPTNPRWSPDGERLLFAGSSGFIGRIYSVRVEEAFAHAPDQILEGSFVVRSQADVDELLDPTAQSITIVGDLRIIDSDLSDLAGLSALRSVAGGFIIEDNEALTSLRGLDSLRLSTGLPGFRVQERETSLVIRGNPLLADVSALAGLKHARRLVVAENDSLTDLSLPALDRTGVLRIQQNPHLQQVAAPQLRHAYLFITSNERLELMEFPLVASGNVRLSGLPQLREIRGLSLLRQAT
ncbi:MAG: hypothetical protein HOC05_12085, partial [Gemmatimonadetes bacterium]|nr:hypothetical protein [Gemmatimonadota bacterium]